MFEFDCAILYVRFCIAGLEQFMHGEDDMPTLKASRPSTSPDLKNKKWPRYVITPCRSGCGTKLRFRRFGSGRYNKKGKQDFYYLPYGFEETNHVKHCSSAPADELSKPPVDDHLGAVSDVPSPVIFEGELR